MTGTRDITQMCFSSNVAGIVANRIEQSFYSAYSYFGIEPIKHALIHMKKCLDSDWLKAVQFFS